jgi:hypothetical protein
LVLVGLHSVIVAVAVAVAVAEAAACVKTGTAGNGGMKNSNGVNTEDFGPRTVQGPIHDDTTGLLEVDTEDETSKQGTDRRRRRWRPG